MTIEFNKLNYDEKQKIIEKTYNKYKNFTLKELTKKKAKKGLIQECEEIIIPLINIG